MAYGQNPNGYAGVSSYGMPKNPAQIRNELAAAMLANGNDYSAIRSPWQGAARLGSALAGALLMRQGLGGWQQGAQDRQQIIGGGGGAPPPAGAGVSGAMPQGGAGVSGAMPQGGGGADLSNAPMPPVRPPDLGGGAAVPPTAPQFQDQGMAVGMGAPSGNAQGAPVQLAYNGPGLPQGLSIPPGFTDASQPGPDQTAAPIQMASAGGGGASGLYQGLLERGYDPVHAAALVGNMRQESNFDPTADNPKEGAEGLIQWRGDRFANLQRFAAAQGADWRDPSAQLDFIKWEMGGPESAAGAKFAAAQSLPDANAALHSYIRYGDNTEPTRLSYAAQAMGGGVQVADNSPGGGMQYAMGAGQGGMQGLPPPPPGGQGGLGGVNMDAINRVLSNPDADPSDRAFAMQMLQMYALPHQMKPVTDPGTGRTYLLDEFTGQTRGVLPTGLAPRETIDPATGRTLIYDPATGQMRGGINTGLAPRETIDPATGQQIIYDPNTGAERGRVGSAVSPTEVIDGGTDMMGVKHRWLRNKVTGQLTPLDASSGAPMPGAAGAPAGLPPPPSGAPMPQAPAGAQPPSAPPAASPPAAGAPPAPKTWVQGAPLAPDIDAKVQQMIGQYAGGDPRAQQIIYQYTKGLLQGNRQFVSNGLVAKEPTVMAAEAIANAVDPDGMPQTRFDTIKQNVEVANPTSLGGQRMSATTSFRHLGALAEASDLLGAQGQISGSEIGAKVQDWAQRNLGGASGNLVTASQAYQAGLIPVLGEIDKLYKGGQATDTEVKEMKEGLSPTASPAARQSALTMLAGLLKDKADVLQSTWHMGVGKSFPDLPIIDKKGQDALDYIGKWGTPASPAAPSGGRGGGQPSMPEPKSKAERDALPPGARYVAPDGSVRVR